MNLRSFSIQELSQKIKTNEISAVDVVDQHIQQIEKVNPTLNAVVETRYDLAKAEAIALDQKLSKMNVSERKNLSEFFGVPCSIKEMISVAGMKSTLGSIHRKNQIMDVDATCVERLKNKDAIILGTTNVPEVGFWFECDNVVYGRTHNPFDSTRTSGGSSGGEAAIISAGGTTFGVGSDIGGSIRMPAAFCGIFGHKPSDKIIAFTGHVPLYQNNANEIFGNTYPFTVLGPLARKAEDLELIMRTLIGPDSYDLETKKNFVLKPLLNDISSIQVFHLPSPVIHGTSETENDLSQAVIIAARYLKEMGAQSHQLPDRTFLDAFNFWTGRAWTIEGKNFPNYLSAGEPLNLAKEFFNLALGKRNYTLPSLLTALVETHHQDRSKKDEYLAGLALLKSELTKKLGQNGILIMPVHPRKAPAHNSTFTRPFDFAYTGVFNALGFPATSVPMGLSNEGLPLSVQVIAAEDQDHLCLSAAKWLEQGFGGSLDPKI